MKKLRKNELYDFPLFEEIKIINEADLGTDEPYEKPPYVLHRIKGTASRGNFVNKNGRMYPTRVLEKAVSKAQESIKRGKLLGEVDHPEESGTLEKAAIKYTKLWMDGDVMLFEGDVIATKKGEHLALLLNSGIGVGISTRGYGSVRPVEQGNDTIYEVQDDYELKGIDCVLEESNVFGKVSNFESKEPDADAEDADDDDLSNDHIVIENGKDGSKKDSGDSGDDDEDDLEDPETADIEEPEEEPEDDVVLDKPKRRKSEAKKESEETQGGNEDMELTLDILQKDFPEIYEQVRESATAEKMSELKDELEKQLDERIAQAIEAKQEELMAEAIQTVMESDEVSQLKSVVTAIIEAIKPVMPEAKTKEDLEADLVDANEALGAKVAELESAISDKEDALRAVEGEKIAAERKLEEHITLQKVAEKVNSLVEGHRFEKALRDRLVSCKTEDEAVQVFESEVAFISTLVENSAAPTGIGKVDEAEDKKEPIDEAVARQKRLAGL